MTIFKDASKNLKWVLLFSTCFMVVGCSSGDGLDKRYKVSGKVTYKGAPVAKGTISFMPVKPDGRGASGQIVDGSYQMTTQEANDGAFPGEYTVTIDALTADLSAAEAEAKKKGATSVALPQDMVAKAYKNAKNAVPAKYSQAASSGLKADVKQQSNTINFDLTD